MQLFRDYRFLFLFSALFVALLGYFIWNDNFIGYVLPLGLIGVYCVLFETKFTFFVIIAATPLSINIEEFTDSFGLFIPTEPLCAGLMLLLLFQSLKHKVFPDYLKNSAIFWTVFVYLSWMVLSAIMSEQPLVSVKFIIAKLWFIVPILFFGTQIFESRKAIRLFYWLFISSMVIAITYTVVSHAAFRFAEKEGHWVMWPFFKDHTIYGAIVALVLPLSISFLFSKKHGPLVQFVFIGFSIIILIGLYFSYTRAAWLSIVLGVGIWLLIRFKVKFTWVALVAVLGLGYVWFSWDSIQQDLARNKSEHTTEDFGAKFESAANVTTDASNLERLNRWSCALEMFNERPIMGYGPGVYAMEYARFQDPENLTIISTNFGDGGNAHSEYLGPLAETGFIGMLTVFGFVIAIFYQGITLYNRWPSEDKEMKTLIMGMIIALSTYFIHGFLNNYLDTDKAAVPIWSMCAMFIALSNQLKTKTFDN
ncbi:MAG: O-antigen ligase family protein [Fluviicola sp.]